MNVVACVTSSARPLASKMVGVDQDGLRKAMTGYHDLVESGRRKIYRVAD